jgi:hypothetical protein
MYLEANSHFQVFTVIIVLFWIAVSVQTFLGTISGVLFFSPVLADLQDPEELSSTEP